MTMMEEGGGTTIYRAMSQREVVSKKDVNESVMNLLEENNKMLKNKCARLERENSYLKRIVDNIKGLIEVAEMRECKTETDDVESS